MRQRTRESLTVSVARVRPRRAFRRSSIAVGLGLAVTLFTRAVVAQVPPGPVPALGLTTAPDEATRAQLQLADDSLASDALAAARGHLLDALQHAPNAPEILGRLMRAAPADSPARWWWAYRHALATADAKGVVPRPSRALKQWVPDQAMLKKLVSGRSKAATELLQYAQRLPTKGKRAVGAGALAAFAASVASELLEPMPAQRAAQAGSWRTVLGKHGPDYDAVLSAVTDLLARAPDSVPAADDQAARAKFYADCDIALRAARVLTGLGAQTGFRNLQGPPPPSIDSEVSRGLTARARIRELVADSARVWTVAELESLGAPERAVFTQHHATWARPARASSPSGLYVIETTCGFETLLGAAKTVELHHRRLADYFGKDPFGSRQGTVRIVPESAGLESESMPHWWAGGFQAGDLTTVRFAWGSIAGLGRLLTHELTHRFDGALRPFQPSWLVEGKAVWTGGSYGRMDEDSYRARYLDRGRVSSAFAKGYGGVRKLTELIEGSIEDYRDNYVAGYALYVFLSDWRADREDPESALLFAERLQAFMRNARAGRKQPLDFFVRNFCDGEDGRPADLEAFAGLFREFLEACYKRGWGEKIGWLDRGWKTTRARDIYTRQVEDAPTMSWARTRAEPAFGQAHAAAAGFLLDEVGKRDAAIAAWTWALAVDGWRDDVAIRLDRALQAAGRDDVAWVVARRGAAAGSAWLGRSGAGTAGVDTAGAGGRAGQPTGDELADSVSDSVAGPAPMLARWSRMRSWLGLLESAVEERRGSSVELARMFAVQRDDFARLLGIPPIEPGLPAPAAVAEAEPGAGDGSAVSPPLSTIPAPEPPRALGDGGYGEEGLTGFEDRRREGLWFETARGDLHVGRERPRDESGLLDRRSVQRDAFALATTWQRGGRYVVRTRVHFTTSFVRGAFVLGFQRRDRNIRVGFRAGNFRYSIGRSEAKTDIDSVSIDVRGLWERVPQLDRRLRRNVDFESPRSSFELELRVDGPRLEVWVEGERRVLWATPDGSDIAGRIGLAMGQGAVRLQRPTVQRLDRLRFDRDPGAPRFDPLGPSVEDYDVWLGRPVRNVPRSTQGSIVVLVPSGVTADAAALRIFDLLDVAFRDAVRYPQPWLLVLPASMPAGDRKSLADQWQRIDPKRFSVLEHRLEQPFRERPFALFIDGVGLLRVAVRMGSGGLPTAVDRWASRSRTTSGYAVFGPR